jgi:hypothetical protein
MKDGRKEGERGLEDEEEDGSSYWITLRKREDTETESGSTRSHSVVKSRSHCLWTCREEAYRMNV